MLAAVLLVVAPPAAAGARPPLIFVLAASLLLLGGVFARARWWVFRSSRAEVDEALTATCRMTLVRLLVTSDGYEIQTGGAPLFVTVSHRGPVLQLTFPGAWRAARKGVLVRNLIAKQFQPMVPRLRIHLRRSR